MNILYLHGLDSSLNNEKRTVLEKFGTVYAPTIDYRKNPNTIKQLLTAYKNHDPEINVVIGSSMGGFAGYYISEALNRPALLFNPALVSRSVTQEVPDAIISSLNLKHIILGAKDDIVDPNKTLQFLSKTTLAEYRIHTLLNLGHRIPVAVFKEAVEDFFAELCY